MEKLDLYDIVKKLTGEINPVGEFNEDNKRFENLKVVTELVEKLIIDIDEVTIIKDRHEYSMNKAGIFAKEFLDSLGIEE